MLGIFAVATVLSIASFASVAGDPQASPVGLPVPPGIRFGMTAAELERSAGARLERLPGRWQYGGAYAEAALAAVEVGGIRFTAYFQMNEATERLQQVLLEARGARATAAAFETTVAALTAANGPPAEACAVAGAGGGVRERRALWRLPTATLHAAFFDFSGAGLVLKDPNVDADPLDTSLERRRNNPRFFPKRLVVRSHPPERRDLEGALSCDAGEKR